MLVVVLVEMLFRRRAGGRGLEFIVFIDISINEFIVFIEYIVFIDGPRHRSVFARDKGTFYPVLKAELFVQENESKFAFPCSEPTL